MERPVHADALLDILRRAERDGWAVEGPRREVAFTTATTWKRA